MLSTKRISRRFGGEICRSCINEQYSVRLKPSDCLYMYPYRYQCACCGTVQNIVTGFRLTGKLKMLTKM